MPGSSIGQRLVLTSFGESHGKCVGAVLDGCPAGLELDEKDIQPMLNYRRPGQSALSTQRKEGEVNSAIIAPIVGPAGCFGVLYVDNAMDHEHYNLSDLDYLMLLAIHTSAILENF